MSISEDGGLIVGLIMGLLLGFVLACAILSPQWEKLAIENGCAYYDAKTAVLTWKAEAK